MEKTNKYIEIKANPETNSIDIYNLEVDKNYSKFVFRDSHDFCKFFLELARDMGINRFDFVAACNAVADEIEGWDNS